jgi:hypothetical protein
MGLEPFIVIMKELKLICLMLGKRGNTLWVFEELPIQLMR